MSLSSEDIAALRKDGDLESYLRSLTGAAPKPAPAEPAARKEPDYVIPHRGAWPLGTAATGPTPEPDRCSCIKCRQPAPVIAYAGTPPEADHDTTAA